MDKRKYYSDLFSLFEASAAESENAQEKIASEGSDMEDPNLVPASQQEEIENGNNEEDVNNEEENIEDADYLMNGENQMAQPPVDNSAILDVEKKEKLFDLFKNLLSYGDMFLDSLKSIDLCLIDDDKAEKMNNLIDMNEKTNEKIKTFIYDSFEVSNYEKALYIYILLRTELLSIIKEIRELLELGKEEII